MRNLKEECKILYSAIEFKILTMNFGGDRTKYKSPAEDGFSKEFYETFFELIGLHLINSQQRAIVNISEAWSYLFHTERRFLPY